MLYVIYYLYLKGFRGVIVNFWFKDLENLMLAELSDPGNQ